MNAAQETLNRLRRVGWHSGAARGPGGQECLVTAMANATMSGNEYVALRDAAQATLGTWIPRWNDEPERTFDDVEDLLRKLGAE